MRFDRAQPQRPPRPRVDLEIGRTVHGWVLRGLTGAAAALATLVVDNVPLTVAAAAIVVLLPRMVTVAALALVAGWWMLQQPPALATAAVLVLALHLVLVLARLAGSVSPLGRVELRLVWRTLGTFVMLQLITQALLGLAFAAMVGMPAAPWFAVIAFGAVVTGVVMALRWFTANTER